MVQNRFLVSLVIATVADDGCLDDCLKSLVALDDPPDFEVVIVDQNGDDRLDAVIAAYAGKLEIICLRVGFRGASRARNAGAEIARGRWIGFPDDDCRLCPDTLAQLAAIVADQPELRIVTGRTVDDAGQPNVLRWSRVAQHFEQESMFGCVTEATLFVERDAYRAAGGFDERFGPGTRFPAAEGIDLVNRLIEKLGPGRAYFTPAIQMMHPTKTPPWTRWAAGRFHAYAIGDGALIAKNPQRHMLRWGARTFASAGVQVFTLPPWRSAAFAARLAGMIRGAVAFRLGGGAR